MQASQATDHFAAGRVQLSPQARAGEAFQAIARHCLRQFIANKAAVLAGDAEALHGMRIALRRRRTALRVFSAVVGNRDPGRIKSELRWISRELGPARDVDVFIADVVAPLRRRYSRDRAVMRVSRDFERRRAALYGEVAVTLRSRRLCHLESQLEAASPPKFDGPGGLWSPEGLLYASLADCFILTFRAVARATGLEWQQLECRVEGVLERVERVAQFTRYSTFAKLTVAQSTDVAQAHELFDRAERTCLIANSVRGDRKLDSEVVVEPRWPRGSLAPG